MLVWGLFFNGVVVGCFSKALFLVPGLFSNTVLFVCSGMALCLCWAVISMLSKITA